MSQTGTHIFFLFFYLFVAVIDIYQRLNSPFHVYLINTRPSIVDVLARSLVAAHEAVAAQVFFFALVTLVFFLATHDHHDLHRILTQKRARSGTSPQATSTAFQAS
jgi:hypothetical protein